MAVGITRIGKITADGGDGTYTFTEQRYNAAGNAWENCPAGAGIIGGTVTDINASQDGSVDDLIHFWNAHGLAGNSLYACDVTDASGTDELSKVSSNDTTAGYLLGKIVGDGGNIGAPVEVNDAGDEDLKIVHAVPQQTGTFKITDIEAGGWVKVMDMEIDANGHIVAIQDSSSTWHQTEDQ